MDGLRSVAERQPWSRLCVVLRRVCGYNDHKLDDVNNNDLIDDDGPRDDHGSRDDYDRSRNDYDYNGGRKGYYNPSANYDHLINYVDDSGPTAATTSATAASRTDND